jgi:7 transmembrane receptor (rhodopsin family).
MVSQEIANEIIYKLYFHRFKKNNKSSVMNIMTPQFRPRNGPNNQHPTPHPHHGEGSNEELKRSVDLTIGVIVAILNVLEIILILRLKRKKKIFEVILLSLSVADLLFGLSNASVCVVFLGNWKSISVFDVSYTTYFFFVLTSILHLIFIALDRLAAIVRPIRHNIFMTRKKVYICLAVVWIVAAIAALILYLTNDKGYLLQNKAIIEQWKTTRGNMTNRTRPPSEILVQKDDTYRTFMQELLSYFILIADSLLVIVYTLIIYKVQLKNRGNKSIRGKENHVTETKVSLLCVLVAVSFVLFTIPYAINRLVSLNIQFLANVVLVSNSGMNSIIYFFRNYCEQKAERQRKKNVASSSGFTPLSTPLSSRHNICESVNNSPQLTLRSDIKKRLEGSRETITLATITH